MIHHRIARSLLVGLVWTAVVLAGCGGDGGTGPENRSPSASISSPSDGASFVEGSRVTLRGSASDPDQGSLAGSALSWASDLDGDLGSGTSVTRSDLSVGDHVVTLTATDSEGATGSATVSFTVEPNQEPSATIASPSDGDTYGQGAPVEFRGGADDPEEGELTGASLEWASDLDGSLGTDTLVTRTDLSVGDHAITLVATDGPGATDTASVTITVEANGQPTASIASPSDGTTVQEDQSITFQGSGSDPEDGALTGGSLVWASDVDGQIGTGESFSRSDLTSGDHTITLAATDSRNASSTASVGLTVEGDPTVTITSPANESIFQEGDGVTFQGSADDPGDGPLTGGSLVWSSSLDGEIGTGGSVSTSSLSGGAHTVTLTATDSEGTQGSASVQILVESPGFQIQTRILDDLTSNEESTLEAGLAPWETAITGDLESGFPPDPDPSFPDDVNECLDGAGGVDDLVVCVLVVDIDGSGGTLAQAGPVFKRTTNGLPVIGRVFIDQADRSNPQLREIVTHEVGHVLGIGVGFIDGWGDNAVGVQNTNDPYFDGSEAHAAFGGLGGEAYLSDGVPLENLFGGGTRGAHWREANFGNELMTGILNSGSANPLSTVTLAALRDVGFTVDLSSAESYTLPMPQVALWEAEADATLSEPTSQDENFGLPDGSTLSESLVTGANNATWSGDPDGEVLTGLVRFGAVSIPSGVSLTSAALRLFLRARDTETTGHDVEVVPVGGAWSEGSVTAASAPSLGGSPVLTFQHDSCTQCALTSSELVQLVRDWSSGATANHGLALRAPDAASDPTFSVGFWTRHASDASQRPHLRVAAQTGAPLRGLTVQPGEGLRMVNDVLELPVYGLTPDGRVINPDGRELRPAR